MLPDPRIVPYIANNHPFPESLIAPLDAYLDHLASTLRDLDNEIVDIEAVLHRLKNQRRCVHHEQSLYLTCRSPARRIPAELITRIMRLAVADHGQPLDQKERQVFKNLRCVSSVWRHIAFSTQDLWRNLVFPFDGVSLESWESGDVLNSWLARGGSGAPRNLVALNGKPTIIRNCEVALDWVMAVLDNPTYNIVSLTLDPQLFLDGLMYINKPPVEGQPRNLKNLTLALTLPNRQEETLDLDAAYPQLECLAIMDCTRRASTLRPIMVIHPNVTSLCLHRVSGTIGELTTLLNGLPSLEELVLVALTVDISTGGIEKDIHLRALERLIIVAPHATTFELYRLMACPSLEFILLEEVPNFHRTLHRGMFAETLGRLVEKSEQPCVLDLIQGNPNYIHRRPDEFIVLNDSPPPVHRLHVNTLHRIPAGMWQSRPLANSLRQIVVRNETDAGKIYWWARNSVGVEGNARNNGFKLELFIPRPSSLPEGRRELEEAVGLLMDFGIQLKLLPPGTINAMLDEYLIRCYEYHRVLKYSH